MNRTLVASAIADHINEVQDALGRPYHLEKPSNYPGFAHSTMTETASFAELVQRTGRRLLCDVSNMRTRYVAARALLERRPFSLIQLAVRVSIGFVFFNSGMLIVIQVLVYPQAWVEHLLWASTLVLLLTRGPGVLSLDHVIERWLARRTAA